MNENKKIQNLIFIIHKGKSFILILLKQFLLAGSRKYKCDICNKYFKEPGNLKTHKKIHVSLKIKFVKLVRRQALQVQIRGLHQKFHHFRQPESPRRPPLRQEALRLPLRKLW